MHKLRERRLATAVLRILRRQQAELARRVRQMTSVTPADVARLVRPTDRELRDVGNAELLRASLRGSEQALRNLRSHQRQLVKTLTYNPDGQVLIRIPQEVMDKIRNLVDETFTTDYWRQIDTTTRFGIAATIETGIANHLTTAQIAELIMQDPSGQFSWARSLMIARTETTMALNAGHWAVEDQMMDEADVTGVVGRQWIAVGDPFTRPAHMQANRQRIVMDGATPFVHDAAGAVIGQGRTFIVGGERARFPGDPQLTPGNRINCRCTLISVFDDEV